jgi:RimJ/RimL family protein N-acetyltransferase
MSEFPPYSQPVVIRPPGNGLIYGSRALLRSYEAGFSEDELARLYRWSRDPEVLRWSGGSPVAMSFADFKHVLHKDQLHPDLSRVIYGILTLGGELIGRIGYFDIEPQRRQAELGVVIGEKEYWGLGYGRDAVCTLLRHVYETTDLHRIYLFTYADNVRARRCFAHCGFRPVVADRTWRWSLQPANELEMEITRTDWEQYVSFIRRLT